MQFFKTPPHYLDKERSPSLNPVLVETLQLLNQQLNIILKHNIKKMTTGCKLVIRNMTEPKYKSQHLTKTH